MEVLALTLLVSIALAVLMLLFLRKSKWLGPSRRALIALDPPLQLDEDVQFTVYRPQQVVPERWYTLLTFAHQSGPVTRDGAVVYPSSDVQRQAQALLQEKVDSYRHLTSDAVRPVPRGGELVVVPEMDGVEFNPDRATFRWEQAVHRADFQLRVRAGVVPRTCRGRVTVMNGPLLIAEVPLAIEVVQHVQDVQMAAGEPGRKFRRIFASYSHRDRAIVERFENYVESIGDRYARDVRDLRAGQVWSDEIRNLIEAADVFQLFWSWNALSSVYVKQEWEYALALKRPDFVRPVYWEDPLPSTEDLPPEPLKRLHFYRWDTATGGDTNVTDQRPSASVTKSARPLLVVLAVLVTTGISLPLYFATRTAIESPPISAPPTDTPVLTPPPKQMVVFEDIYFQPGEAGLSDAGRSVVDAVATSLRQNPDVRVSLEGHTAATGEREYNLALGERRAAAVRDHLIQQGIEPGRLRIVSYGEERPQHDNSRPETRRLNDRVSVQVHPPSQP